MMHFHSKCFYLMYIINYVVVRSSELEFKAMALGHSGLLIYFDSTKVANDCFYFNVTAKALASKQGISYAAAEHNREDIFARNFFSVTGQYKFHSLNEDTHYEVTIIIEDLCVEKHPKIISNHTVTCKTHLKNKSPPEKPYFTWKLSPSYNRPIIITWVPCNKERNCQGNEAGTHFAVKYKMLESRETITIIEYIKGFTRIFIGAGRIYEFTVISINGDFETSSDPQEVFLKPCSSPVHSVRVFTLNNTSIYVLWKRPKWFTNDTRGYNLLHNSKSDDKMLQSNRDQPQIDIAFDKRRRITHLEPNIVNTFTIIPFCEDEGVGFEYRFNYSIKPIQTNLPMAKPDFIIDTFATTHDGNQCYWYIFWVPCDEISDCENMSVGSDCEVEIQDSNDTKKYRCSTEHDRITTNYLEKNRTYRFIGKSVNEYNQTSDSVTKQISCDGVEDV